MAVTQARNSDLTQKQEEAFQQLLPRFKRSGLIRALLLARGIPQRDICTRHGFR